MNVFDCPVCGFRALIWQNDYDFEDLGYEGSGIVREFVCGHCGCEVEARIPIEGDKEE